MFLMKNIKKLLNESSGDIDYALFAENHRFVVPDECHWNDVREVTVNVGNKIQNFCGH